MSTVVSERKGVVSNGVPQYVSWFGVVSELPGGTEKGPGNGRQRRLLNKGKGYVPVSPPIGSFF